MQSNDDGAISLPNATNDDTDDFSNMLYPHESIAALQMDEYTDDNGNFDHSSWFNETLVNTTKIDPVKMHYTILIEWVYF